MNPLNTCKGITELKNEVATFIDCNLPVMIWGPSGIGKSDGVAQLGAERSLPVIDVRLSQMAEVDLRGLPKLDDSGRSSWATPTEFPFIGTDHGPEGILFLDELSSCNPAVATAAYQLILDRAIGPHRLMDGWRIVAAGNRASDRGVVYKMPAPLANRFAHLSAEADQADFLAWGGTAGLNPGVLGYIGFRPEVLHQFDARSEEQAFPSPRSWAMVSRILSTNPANPGRAVAACIGTPAATEFVGFLGMMDLLPTVSEIEADPTGVDRFADSPGLQYAVAIMVAYRMNSANLGPRSRYLERLNGEIAQLAWTIAERRSGEDLRRTPEFDRHAKRTCTL